jgi:hypothetical protein
MKKIFMFLTVAGILCASPAVLWAEEGHDHSGEAGDDHAKQAGHAGQHAGGPKGGRLLENVEPHAEFFVEKDRTASLTFYDDSMKPIPASGQSASLSVDTNGNKTKLEFEQKGDILVTTGSLPEGGSHNIVLHLRQTAEAKPTNFRFTLDGNVCAECKRAEYACICAH